MHRPREYTFSSPQSEVGEYMRALLGIGFVCSLLIGCKSAPPPMSLDEAKKISADFQEQGFVPPPRTTVDITTILEQAKPDTAALAVRRAIATAPTQPNAPAFFFYLRGQ